MSQSKNPSVLKATITKILRLTYPELKMVAGAKQFVSLNVLTLAADVARRAKEIAGEDSQLQARHVQEALHDFLHGESLKRSRAFAHQSVFNHTTDEDKFVPKEPRRPREAKDRVHRYKLQEDLLKEVNRVKKVLTHAHPTARADEGCEAIVENLSVIGMKLMNHVIRNQENSEIDLESTQRLVLEILPGKLGELSSIHCNQRIAEYRDGILSYERKPMRKTPSKRQRSKSRAKSKKTSSETSRKKKRSLSRTGSETSRRKAPPSRKKSVTTALTKKKTAQSRKKSVTTAPTKRKTAQSRKKSGTTAPTKRKTAQSTEKSVTTALTKRKTPPSRKKSVRTALTKRKTAQSRKKSVTTAPTKRKTAQSRKKSVTRTPRKTDKPRKTSRSPLARKREKSVEHKPTSTGKRAETALNKELKKNLASKTEREFRVNIEAAASETMNHHLLNICRLLMEEIGDSSKNRSAVTEKAVSSAVEKHFPKQLSKHAIAYSHQAFFGEKAQQRAQGSSKAGPKMLMEESSSEEED